MTSIHNTLHAHLAEIKIYMHSILQNLTVSQQKAYVNRCEEMLKNYNHGVSKAEYNIYTGGSMCMNLKVNSSQLCGSFKMSQIWQVLFAQETL